MESNNIYKQSYEYLRELKKSLVQDSVTIDFTKFDSQTAGALKQSMYEILTKRSAEVGNVILSNNRKY